MCNNNNSINSIGNQVLNNRYRIISGGSATVNNTLLLLGYSLHTLVGNLWSESLTKDPLRCAWSSADLCGVNRSLARIRPCPGHRCWTGWRLCGCPGPRSSSRSPSWSAPWDAGWWWTLWGIGNQESSLHWYSQNPPAIRVGNGISRTITIYHTVWFFDYFGGKQHPIL